MSRYTEATDLFIRTTQTEFRLVKPLVWRIGSPLGPEYTVPKGYVFDVSIPKGLWWLFSPFEMKYFKAAAIHDHMLSVSEWDRVTSAANFYQALKADGVSFTTRLIMWLAVTFYKFD